jgi:hypothetical protein
VLVPLEREEVCDAEQVFTEALGLVNPLLPRMVEVKGLDYAFDSLVDAVSGNGFTSILDWMHANKEHCINLIRGVCGLC